MSYPCVYCVPQQTTGSSYTDTRLPTTTMGSKTNLGVTTTTTTITSPTTSPTTGSANPTAHLGATTFQRETKRNGYFVTTIHQTKENGYKTHITNPRRAGAMANKDNKAAIIATCLVVTFFLAILLIALLLFMRKRRRKTDNKSENHQMESVCAQKVEEYDDVVVANIGTQHEQHYDYAYHTTEKQLSFVPLGRKDYPNIYEELRKEESPMENEETIITSDIHVKKEAFECSVSKPSYGNCGFQQEMVKQDYYLKPVVPEEQLPEVPYSSAYVKVLP